MLKPILVFLNVVLVVAVFFLAQSVNKYKESFRQTSLFQKWPIQKVEIGEFDARFKPETYGPSKNTEVYFIGNYGTRGSISDFETWILCTFAKTSSNIFEFGTFTGKTTYLMAKNSPEDCKVVTLTLSPEELSNYKSTEGDTSDDTKSAIDESIFNDFYYTNDKVAPKITQLFSDSKTFDESSYESKMDLIFIDGSHAQSYVENDTKKALRMIKPGGIIIWHDYRGPNRTQGVYKTLNQLQKSLKLFHIAGTSMVAYKHPA